MASFDVFICGAFKQLEEACVAGIECMRLGVLRNIRVVLQSSCWTILRDLVSKIVKWEALGGF